MQKYLCSINFWKLLFNTYQSWKTKYFTIDNELLPFKIILIIYRSFLRIACMLKFTAAPQCLRTCSPFSYEFTKRPLFNQSGIISKFMQPYLWHRFIMYINTVYVKLNWHYWLILRQLLANQYIKFHQKKDSNVNNHLTEVDDIDLTCVTFWSVSWRISV